MAVILFVSACLLAFAAVERRLSTTPITGPIVFVALGLLASGDGIGIIDTGDDSVVVVVNTLFQGTLALLLFTDASALHFTSWRRDAELPGRLLGIGLPLTIGLTAIFAVMLFTDLSIWEAAIIGAITAPTDAALGQAVVSNPRVPERIRQALDVESGLNDGVSLPFLLIFIGLAEQEAGDTGALLTFVREIGVAVGVGVLVGVLGALLLVWAAKAGWMGTGWSNVATVSIALISFVAADALGGSGFIAAFVAGLSYGHTKRDRIKNDEVLGEELGLALVQVSFLAFGALVLPRALDRMTWQTLVMAILALTLARIVPVAISLIGTRMGGVTIAYLGWFGPRGLATVVFAAEVLEEADVPGVETITGVAVMTVALSVLLHGLTAYPGSQRYADWYESQKGKDVAEAKPLQHPHPHPRLRHSRRLDRHVETRPEPTNDQLQ
jgi:NhaP-type Na+/H+ or K+/H+ antiporter